jgi:hypothetical protein
MTAPAAPGIALLRLLLAAAAVGAVAAALPLAADPQPSPGAAAPAVAVVLWHRRGDYCPSRRLRVAGCGVRGEGRGFLSMVVGALAPALTSRIDVLLGTIFKVRYVL